MLVIALESVFSSDLTRFNYVATICYEIYSIILYLNILLQLRALKLSMDVLSDCVIIVIISIDAHKKHFIVYYGKYQMTGS